MPDNIKKQIKMINNLPICEFLERIRKAFGLTPKCFTVKYVKANKHILSDEEDSFIKDLDGTNNLEVYRLKRDKYE